MESLKIILVSLKRNKGKSAFIVFQLALCSLLMLFFLGQTEKSFVIYNKTSTAIVDNLFQGLCDNLFDNSKYSEFAGNIEGKQSSSGGFNNRNLKDVYNILSKDNRVKSIGRTSVGMPSTKDTDTNTIKIKGRNLELVCLDEGAINLFNYKVVKGQNFREYFKNNKEDGTIPILVGSQIEEKNSLGSIVEIPECVDKNNNPYKCKIIGVLDPKQPLKEDDAQENGLNFKGSVVVSSKLIHDFLVDSSGSRSDFQNIYFTLKNDKDIEDIKEELNLKIPDSFVYIKNLGEEIKYYTEMEKKHLSSISDIVAMVILATFGIMGISLSTLRKRKKEIGIRYSLGCSKKNIVLMLLGENLILYILSIGVVSIAMYLISKVFSGIIIDGWVIGITLGIMAAFMIISILPLVVKLMKLKPIELLRPKE
ncbi:ABC transporter permease [Inconstantimicrobium mannanitabidum]|uniref:Uncharacterized protein n=1 Tax=Inconstantimicrobium mannanitabidum TaxID=1604901 RepID=A0ACB5RCN3_9CLOT|nr:ABC transporter permease [Clostridium sp. TW13]GKX67020.1 hypothetical protein rsdtw13_22780 [Clostridium sp. TW13]